MTQGHLFTVVVYWRDLGALDRAIVGFVYQLRAERCNAARRAAGLRPAYGPEDMEDVTWGTFAADELTGRLLDERVRGWIAHEHRDQRGAPCSGR